MAKKPVYFKKGGFVHIPTNAVGLIIIVLMAIFLFTVFTAIDRNSHSASDTLYGIFPYFVTTFLLYDWLADKLS